MANLRKSTPFRADHVGSLLRSHVIKQARSSYEAGEITKERLREIENKEIIRIVEKQKEIGLKGITDGEFRRAWWHLDFLEHLNGVEGYEPEKGYTFKGITTKAYNVRIVDKISFNPNHPFLEDFKFLASVVGKNNNVVAKQTIPSPNMLVRTEIMNENIYPTKADFYHDLSETYKAAIKAFYDAGCRYLQIDDTNFAALIDENVQKRYADAGIDIDSLTQSCVDILNAALEDRPTDLKITMHICRGNFSSAWIYAGGYEKIASYISQINIDGFFLEYDDKRSGGFEPLKYWRNLDKQIVLGLITTKNATLEDKEVIYGKVNEATKYIPLKNICLSPQCGFASTEEGNHLNETEQWEKLRFVCELANEIWGENPVDISKYQYQLTQEAKKQTACCDKCE